MLCVPLLLQGLHITARESSPELSCRTLPIAAVPCKPGKCVMRARRTRVYCILYGTDMAAPIRTRVSTNTPSRRARDPEACPCHL